MFGQQSGKILRVAVFSKCCSTCERAKREDPPAHDCPLNWVGSAKCMEPAGAVAIAKDLQTKGVKVSHLIGDDDATTIAHLRSQVNASIAKSSDFNHVKKKHRESSVRTSSCWLQANV